MSSLSITTFSTSLLRENDKQKKKFDPKKIIINRLGRFKRDTGEEYPCRLQEISLFEASLLSSILPNNGENLLCLLDDLPLVEGYVEKQFQGGFVVAIDLTARGRKLLGDRLNNLNNLNVSSERFSNQKQKVFSQSNWAEITFKNRSKSICRVEDLSLLGASLITEARPPVGTEVSLNQILGRVEDHHTYGINIAFIDIKKPKGFRRHF